MMTKRCWLCAVALVALGLVGLAPTTSEAQKKKPPDPEEMAQKEKERYVKDLMLAYELKELGLNEDHRSPESLIAAARILRRLSKVPLAKMTEKPTIELEKEAAKDDKAIDEVNDEPDLAKEAKDLLAKARAQNEKLKLGLDKAIADVETSAGTRAAIGGPRNINRTVGRHQRNVFQISYQAHLPATVGWHSNIPIRVKVVRTDTGNVILDDELQNGVWHWSPGLRGQRTGTAVPFTITVVNPHNSPAHYHLYTN